MYLEVKGLKKSYGEGGSYAEVLKGADLSVEKGAMCVIQGASGSGKSTLLHCIGGLDEADSGSVSVDGMEICGLPPEELSDYRRANLGFIFQFYNLVPNLTVTENIQVCEYLTDSPLDLRELLDTLGLAGHQDKFPSQLSGGQQQRCAIARAIAAKPSIILADEPTGNLDTKTGDEVMALLKASAKKYGQTLVVITHNEEIAQMADRTIMLADGRILSSGESEVASDEEN